jgi:RHS repeat-associated protein
MGHRDLWALEAILNPSATGQPQGSISRNILYDGLGRVKQTQLTDPLGTDYVDTTYDGNGRVYSVSNPHRSTSSTSDGTTTTTYDASDRPKVITNQDGTTKQFSYNTSTNPLGLMVTSIDEKSNQWTRITNGIGQLKNAFEPNGTSQSATMETDYTYDPVGDLLTVTQWGGVKNTPGGRNRSFTYDGTSRLLTATNPENGTTTYTYSNDLSSCSGDAAAPCTRTDARGVKTTYSYDNMNRLNWKRYNDGVTITAGFGYDGNDATGNPISPAVTNAKGRLSQLSMLAAQAITNISYDPMGRVSQKVSCVPGDCNYDLKVNATYDFAGNVLTLTDISPAKTITLTQTYDAANHLKAISASPTVNSISTLFKADLTSPVSYGPAGLQYAQLGVNTSGAATFTMTRSYDNRLRRMYEGYKNSGGTSLYSYCVPGTANTNCTTGGPGFEANGNLAKVIDSVTGTWTYNYDTLNRVTSSSVSGGPDNGQIGCWAYDAFGNRTSEAMSTTACTSNPPKLSWATYTTSNTNRMDSTSVNSNQINGYDAAGDVTNDGLYQYLYDGEGRVCAAKNTLAGTMTQYIYDSAGNRVGKGTITTFSCVKSTNGYTPTASYMIGLNGEQAIETNGSTGWVHTNVYANGALLATYKDATTNLYFAFNDWLGTKRGQGEILSASTCVNTYFSLPYGNTPSTIGSCPDATEHHFTGKERDSESGNDYFDARYYASTMGRFLSPDWSAKIEPVPYSKLDDPQSLNLYAYVMNNPLVRIDPDGHGCNGWGCLEQQQTEAEKQLNMTQQQQNARAAQQQNGDPTLPAAVQEPGPNLADRLLMKTAPDMTMAVLFDTGLGELAEAGTALMRGLELSAKLTEEGVSGAEKVAKLTEEGDKLFPSKAGNFEMHHNMPKRLGGAEDGPLTRLPASYHQFITSATRTLTKNYTDFSAGAKAIMDKVYSYFPIQW